CFAARKWQRNCVQICKGLLIAIGNAAGKKTACSIHADLSLDEHLPICVDLHPARYQLLIIDRLDELQRSDSLGSRRIRDAAFEEASAEADYNWHDLNVEDRSVAWLGDGRIAELLHLWFPQFPDCRLELRKVLWWLQPNLLEKLLVVEERTSIDLEWDAVNFSALLRERSCRD